MLVYLNAPCESFQWLGLWRKCSICIQPQLIYSESLNRQVPKIKWRGIWLVMWSHIFMCKSWESAFWSTVHSGFWSLKLRWIHCEVKETVVWFALSFGFKGPSPLLWSTWLMLRSLLPHPPTSLATNQYWLSIATYSVADSLFSDVMNSPKQERGSRDDPQLGVTTLMTEVIDPHPCLMVSLLVSIL